MHDLDEAHDHFDFADIGPDAVMEDVEGLEMFTLKSVGIDIGSSTSHLVFSQLTLRREGASLSGRFKVTARKVLFRSPILLTPYLSATLIDVEQVKRFIEQAYQEARMHPDEIDTGAVIITGEALKKENAQPIVEYFAKYSGKFICATAGHNHEALLAAEGDEELGLRVYWYGNFFPDMRAWDKLDANVRRGAGGRSVYMQFPYSEVSAHMSVFAAQTYKKAHRHGPGRAIIIPAGEGFSIMWEEGKEKIVVPWHECSLFVPPNRWFHQHFNVGGNNARYLALHPPMQFHGHAEKVEDGAKDQIEYPDEDPFIRKKFEEDLATRGVQSLMPAEAYTDRNYEWSKAMGKQ